MRTKESPYTGQCIPANFFFSKIREILHLHIPWISEDLPTASEDCQRFPKISEDRERFPLTSEDFSTTSGDNRLCRKIFDDFKTRLTWTVFRGEKLNFCLIGFKQLHSLLSVGREKLFWMREITILDPQAWDSRIMRVGRYHVFEINENSVQQLSAMFTCRGAKMASLVTKL